MSVALIAACAAAAVLVVGVRGAAAVRRAARRPAGAQPRPAAPTDRRWRRGAPTEPQVADWCDQIARSIRSGSSLPAAVIEATAEHAAMQRCAEPIAFDLHRGRSLVDAVARDADPSTAVGFALGVLRTCARLGGPASAPLERAAATLRTRAAIAEEQRVQSAQARLSARVLTLVPLALLALLASAEPDVRGALATAPGGAAVAVGASLNAGGWLWMRRIIGRPR